MAANAPKVGNTKSSGNLANIQKAARALAVATTVDECLQYHDQAEALRVYAKTAKLGLEAQNSAAEVKLRAERRVGELLAADPNFGPGKKCNTLLHFGIEDRMASHRWQTAAKLDAEAFEQFIADAKASGKELTSAAVYKKAKQQAAQSHTPQPSDEPKEPASAEVVTDLSQLSGRKFKTIYADPPWQYGNQGTRASTDNHYGTMPLADICAMPIADLADDDAHLHLWTTNAFLFDAKQVMEAWGFEYRSCFVWVKPQMGIGNYWRVSHEFMLLGIRGNAKSFRDRGQMSWREIDRTKHSAKPREIRVAIEKVSWGPYLELFGRSPVDGWTVYGNQVDSQQARLAI